MSKVAKTIQEVITITVTITRPADSKYSEREIANVLKIKSMDSYIKVKDHGVPEVVS